MACPKTNSRYPDTATRLERPIGVVVRKLDHVARQLLQPASLITLSLVVALSVPSLAKVFQNPDGSVSSSVILEYRGAPVGPDNPFPIQPTYAAPVALSMGDASGTIAAANTFQTAIPGNGARKACTIQNPPGAGENLLVYDRCNGTPTSGNAYVIVPGQTYTCNGPNSVNTCPIQISAATAGHGYVGSVQ